MNKLLYITLSFVVLSMFYIGLSNYFGTNQEVEYITYTVEEGDTMHDIVSKLNDSYDGYYDVRDLVYLMREKNKIDGSNIYVGESYEVPVLFTEDSTYHNIVEGD